MKEGNIWLFGAGNLAEKFIKDMDYEQEVKRIKGILDNAYIKNGKQIDNITVYYYKETMQLIDKNKDKIIITCGKTFAEEIVLQLAQDGLGGLVEGIYMGESIIPYESMYSLRINSQFGEELGLCNIFNKVDSNYKGFYVDVGAYHPFILSNTKWAYDRGWSGINIDADEKNIELFQTFRPRDINLHCGVSDKEGIMPFYKYSEGSCNSFDDSLGRDLSLEKVVDIPVRKLGDILQEYDIDHIDILDIDAEGFDEKIVRSFEWERYRPVCVLIEILSKEKSHFWTSEIHRILTFHGYQFVSLFVKTLMYVREDWCI